MRSALLFLAALPFVSPLAAGEPQWWKGNLHTHTLWSDGDDYPEMIADWYKRQGYHFLALSDHNILANEQKWISVAKTKAGQMGVDKYLARFGKDWVNLRDREGDQEVRLKMLSEFRVPLEEPGRFLMIESEEITGRFLSSPIHINATNIREKIPPQTGASVMEVIDKTMNAVYDQRKRTGVPMFPHLNHPNFGWAITAEEMAEVDKEHFFEVYNGHPTVHNEGDATRASTDRIWDIVLTKRLAELGKGVVYGLAVDDSHNYHPWPMPAFLKSAGDGKKDSATPDGAPPGKTPTAAATSEPATTLAEITAPAASGAVSSVPATAKAPGHPSRPGRGWIMVRAESLETNALIAAIEAGDFYASSGVTLKEVRREKNVLSLEIQTQPGVTYTTEFFGTRKGYDGSSQPVKDAKGQPMRTTRVYGAGIGAVLATATGATARYELKGDEIYVRARVTSTKAKTDPAFKGEVEQAWTQPLVPGRN